QDAADKLKAEQEEKQRQEEAAKKKAEQDAADKLKAEQEEKQRQEQEAAAKKKAEQDAADKLKAEQEEKQRQEEEAAKKKAEQDAADKLKAEQEAAAKKKAEQEAKQKISSPSNTSTTTTTAPRRQVGGAVVIDPPVADAYTSLRDNADKPDSDNWITICFDTSNKKKFYLGHVGKGLDALKALLKDNVIIYVIYRVMALELGYKRPKYLLITWTGDSTSPLNRAFAVSNQVQIHDFLSTAFPSLHPKGLDTLVPDAEAVLDKSAGMNMQGNSYEW
ncbi:hypothetical protein AKO1_001872, partial [Acrasis kona]